MCQDDFRDISRVEMSSCILPVGHPGDTPSQAPGGPASCVALRSEDTAMAPAHGRAARTQRISTLCFIWYFNSGKTSKKPNIYLAGISLKNPFVSQKHHCHQTARDAACAPEGGYAFYMYL